jgi:hypothetical protein
MRVYSMAMRMAEEKTMPGLNVCVVIFLSTAKPVRNYGTNSALPYDGVV